jgi:hypothetical protein
MKDVSGLIDSAVASAVMPTKAAIGTAARGTGGRGRDRDTSTSAAAGTTSTVIRVSLVRLNTSAVPVSNTTGASATAASTSHHAQARPRASSHRPAPLDCPPVATAASVPASPVGDIPWSTAVRIVDDCGHGHEQTSRHVHRSRRRPP